MSRRQFNSELPIIAAAAFNLALQEAEDPWRVDRERWAEAERQRGAREYSEKMQLSLAQCPGFLGCDAPSSEQGQGKVIIEPGRIAEAVPWLKRRYYVNENLGLSSDNGLCVEIKPRLRNKTCAKRGHRVTVNFDKPMQFELRLS